MYQAYKWDAEQRLLYVKGTPGASWRAASMQQTVDYLADQLVLVTTQRDEAVEAARCALAL